MRYSNMTYPRLIFTTQNSPNYLEGNDYSDNDLVNIPKSTVTLNLELSEVTDAGLEKLPELDNLICIDLDGTKITDNGLKHLLKIKSIKEIWIEQTEITNQGLLFLKDLPSLEFISVLDTQITEDGINHFLKLCPGVEVH
ncbi:MAG: hypothetical protein WDZ35_00195 [Crocinitomicaceae bacterium]